MPLRELVFACDFLQKNESLKTEVSKSPAGTNPQEMDLNEMSREEREICAAKQAYFSALYISFKFIYTVMSPEGTNDRYK